jgi:hypothetical protein
VLSRVDKELQNVSDSRSGFELVCYYVKTATTVLNFLEIPNSEIEKFKKIMDNVLRSKLDPAILLYLLRNYSEIFTEQEITRFVAGKYVSSLITPIDPYISELLKILEGRNRLSFIDSCLNSGYT